jgi:L-amino acid N-acyltransferase YncA
MVYIREFIKPDFPSVQSIYQQGIDTGNATFQDRAKDWDEWNASIIPSCRLVADLDGEVVGWAALSSVSSRCVYTGVDEVSVYVSSSAFGRGIGHSLLRSLVESSEKVDIWTLQAGIFPENKSSISIHAKNGFKILGVRERIGKMKGVWRDVVLMERRSGVAGV